MFLSNKCKDCSNNGGAVNRKVSELGFAVLEAAGAMVIVLPLLLVAVGVAIMLHDQSIYRAAPSEALRRVFVPTMQFTPSLGDRTLSFSEKKAYEIVIEIVRQMGVSVPQQAVMMTQPSYKACAWLISVNSITGRSNGIKRTVCHQVGSAAAQLSFTGELNLALKEQIGIPLLDGSGQFASSAVLFGAKVIAKSKMKIVGIKTPDLEYGLVQLPRGEITV
jgi:hypothetical protein